MRRREFLGLVGGAVGFPLAVNGQQAPPAVIGYLATAPSGKLLPELRSFHQGLKELGYTEGQNLSVEYRWSEGRYDRLPPLAADLVARQVTLIVATGVPSVLAAKAATSKIPIVFLMGPDPVKFKVVASLNRPGGNLTGATFFTSTLAPKRLELLRELLPSSSIVGFLVNGRNPRDQQDIVDMEKAAQSLGWSVVALRAGNDHELDETFTQLRGRSVRALIVGADPFFHSRTERFAALTSRYRIPAIFSRREYVIAGGLIGYGTRLTDYYRQIGVYAGRVLNGERPSDLPVMQPTKFELVINIKTAKALGLTIPPTLLARADEVIE